MMEVGVTVELEGDSVDVDVTTVVCGVGEGVEVEDGWSVDELMVD